MKFLLAYVVVVYSNRYGTDEWGGPLVLQVHPETIDCISLFLYDCVCVYVCIYNSS